GTSQDQSQVRITRSSVVELAGWPQQAGTFFIGAPAYADLDNDGRQEIIATSITTGINVWRWDGTPFPGWPRAGISVSVGDIDGDGDPEIVAPNGNVATVYAYHHNGAMV